MSTYVRILAVSLPPLLVAVAASTHPETLTVEHAAHWKHVHTVLIPIFPLLALGPILVAGSVHRFAGVLVAIPAYTYATFYTALDILAGVGGGAIKEVEAGGLGIIFPVAGDFEKVGGIAFVVAAALASAVAIGGLARFSPRRALAALLPTAAVVTGAVMLWQEHIYRPWGMVAQFLLAAGWGAFVVLQSFGRGAAPAR